MYYIVRNISFNEPLTCMHTCIVHSLKIMFLERSTFTERPHIRKNKQYLYLFQLEHSCRFQRVCRSVKHFTKYYNQKCLFAPVYLQYTYLSLIQDLIKRYAFLSQVFDKI